MREGNEAAAELLEPLEDLESGLLELERALSLREDVRPLVHALFRFAHNLKSAFSLQGLGAAAELFHAMETCLDGIREGRAEADSGLIDLLMEAVDEGRRAAEGGEDGGGSEVLRHALLSFGIEEGGSGPGERGRRLEPRLAEALASALREGSRAWILEKSVGPGLDEGSIAELPVIETIAGLGRLVSQELMRGPGGTGLLVLAFVSELSEEELRLAIFDPLIPVAPDALPRGGSRASAPIPAPLPSGTAKAAGTESATRSGAADPRRPAAAPETMPSPGPLVPPPGVRGGPRLRFLAFDEERLNLQLLRIGLDPLGETDCVVTAEEALSRFREGLRSRPYDAVFLDLGLGEAGRIDLVGNLRRAEGEAALGQGEGAKIVVYSPQKDYESISEAFRSQCDEHIVSPLSLEKLREALVRLGLSARKGAVGRRSRGEAEAGRVPEAGRPAEGPALSPRAPSAAAGPDPAAAPDPLVTLGELDKIFGSVPAFEELCRVAIDRGRRFLDLDRLAILLYDPARDRLRCTYGIDPQGRLVDQSDLELSRPAGPLYDPKGSEVKRLLAIAEDEPLLFRGKTVGRGWKAVFPLRNGQEVFGWVAADNLLSGRPLQPVQRWHMALFGQLLSSHLVRKRDRDELVAAIAFLSAESHRQEAELLRLRKEKREELALRERLFGLFTRDLRRPAEALRGLLERELSPGNPADETELRAALPAMRDSMALLWNLLEDGLEWLRGGLEEIGVLREEVSLAGAVAEVLRLLEPELGRKGLALSLELPEGLGVLSDARIIRAILRNFLSNAVKFSPPGSAILVQAARDEEGGEVLLSVIDRGIGMDEGLKALVFGPDPGKLRPGTEGEEGAGLGLVLSADLARRIGARIEVESEPGRGSSFTLALPRREGERLRPL